MATLEPSTMDRPGIEAALPSGMLRGRPRRAGMGTPVVSVALSGVIHALLVLVAATIGWRIAARPDAARSVKVSFDAPGDSGLTIPASPALANATSQTPELSRASIEPAAPEPKHPQTATRLTGLTSESVAAVPSQHLTGLTETTLVSASLFSADPAASGARAAPTSGLEPAAAGAPSVTFGGLGASSVSSVVYAVDCSGPMVTSLPLVIAELERSIGRLSPTQKFGVVLFRRTSDQTPGAESFAPVLVRATPSARQLLHTWLASAEPAGRSSPLAGIETALSLHPDAIFLLSRAIQRSGGGVWELGMEQTMTRLEELNAPGPGEGRPVLIQTIQFLDEDPTGIMQAVGQRFGGGNGYRVVKRQQDLGTSDAARTSGAPNH